MSRHRDTSTRQTIAAFAAVAVLAVVLAAVARCGAHQPEAVVDVAAALVALFRVELHGPEGALRECWYARDDKAETFAAAQQAAHPGCTTRLVPLEPFEPMLSPVGDAS